MSDDLRAIAEQARTAWEAACAAATDAEIQYRQRVAEYYEAKFGVAPGKRVRCLSPASVRGRVGTVYDVLIQVPEDLDGVPAIKVLLDLKDGTPGAQPRVCFDWEVLP